MLQGLAVRRAALVGLLAGSALSGGAGATSASAPPNAASTESVSPSATSGLQLFGATWNQPIRSRPILSANSRAAARLLAKKTAYANLYDFGTPIYFADRWTPAVSVTCTEHWGRCPLEVSPVPVPLAARPNSGSDHAMTVVDRGRGVVYEFWRAQRAPGGWRTAWGAISRINGDGRGGSSGSGISRLAGVITVDEVSRRVIPHALAVSSSNVCARRFLPPATKTDGGSSAAGCLPAGVRLQLDPALDLHRVAGLTGGELAVALAMQRYGVYVVDSGAAELAIGFQRPTAGDNPYPAAGFAWDYYALDHIPLGRLRLLRSWDGS